MLDALISLVIATTALLGSPGPATLALAATGASFGFRQGARFLGGILTGLVAVIILAACGVSALLMNGSVFAPGLLVFSTLYIIYVAFKIASAPIGPNDTTTIPQAAPGFGDGIILNLTNPKAYAAFAALFTAFSLPIESMVLRLAIMAGICFAAAAIIDVLWLGLGTLLAGAFSDPRLARPLRILFATLMIAAVLWSLVKISG